MRGAEDKMITIGKGALRRTEKSRHYPLCARENAGVFLRKFSLQRKNAGDVDFRKED